MEKSVPVVVITGTIGVGKTAIAMTMSEILHERGIRHGLIEVDWLGEVYPAPDEDDPYSTCFAMRNLAAIWPNFLEVGITRAVITMTLENQREMDDLKRVLTPSSVTVVRLEASEATRGERISQRELGTLLDHFLAKTGPLADQMRCLGIGDVVVTNDDRSPQDVASEVIGLLGWG